MRRNWSEDEVRAALLLYLRLEFGKFHKGNPDVIALASRIGRSASAVALKLTNLAALDDSVPQRGMANASATDRKVWQQFLTSPETLIRDTTPLAGSDDLPAVDGFAERQSRYEAQQSQPQATTITRRQGQGFFREMILASYRSRCALTGLEDTRLLTASHIVGWAEDRLLRFNPHNGLCLNALHDRAFDRHLISFDEDYRMIIAPDVPKAARSQLERTDSTRLAMPARFLPSQDFLERHRRHMWLRCN
ncbi:HNH endonuclease [Leisingera sp. XS_AS12]|uniref:HNH endonuclease n=1 Tax=Leisingera sp. XS_AS12 TaxID=3241294 RepID=UPI003516F501